MAAFIENIAVLDKSGKAVSTSKHLVNIYKEAKAAYRERKAEIISGRHKSALGTPTRKTIRESSRHDNHSSSSQSHSRAHHHDSHTSSSENPSASELHRRNKARSASSSSHNNHASDISSPPSPKFQQALTRRHSTLDDELNFPQPGMSLKRAMTTPMPTSKHDEIDMDLAYGPIPPPLPMSRKGEEAEMNGLIQTAKKLLEEADCLQYSATAIIARLQKNPDAMAAVALTLAEISNLARRLAPGVLTGIRNSSPAVFSLLSSPQFLIAGGMAVGVTIVAFGGFKVIKQLQSKNAMSVEAVDEMVEIGGDADRIDNWRRGIADVEAYSTGTSADGEFITPTALAMSRMHLDSESNQETKGKSYSSQNKMESNEASKRKHSEKSSCSSSRSDPRNPSKSRSKAGSSTIKNKRTKGEKKISRPSPLRLMLATGSTTS